MDDFNSIKEVIKWIASNGKVQFEEWVLHMRDDGSIEDQHGGVWGLEGIPASDFSKWGA